MLAVKSVVLFVGAFGGDGEDGLEEEDDEEEDEEVVAACRGLVMGVMASPN